MADDRDTERTTTVVHTERRGGGGLIALAVVLLIAVVLVYMYRDQIFGGASEPQKVEIEVKTPDGGS